MTIALRSISFGLQHQSSANDPVFRLPPLQETAPMTAGSFCGGKIPRATSTRSVTTLRTTTLENPAKIAPILFNMLLVMVVLSAVVIAVFRVFSVKELVWFFHLFRGTKS